MELNGKVWKQKKGLLSEMGSHEYVLIQSYKIWMVAHLWWLPAY